MESLFGQVIDLTVTFNPWLLLAIFVLVLVSEFGLTVPLLLETVWLFTGYNFIIGVISAEHLVLFVVVSMLGRLTGASILFFLSWYGKTSFASPLLAYCKPRVIALVHHVKPLRSFTGFIAKLACRINPGASQQAINEIADTRRFKLFGRRFRPSPLTVAMGRFVWLKLPLTIGLGATRQPFPLLGGVAIFSLAWDTAYIMFGIIGGQSGLGQMQMLFYPLAMVATVAISVFIFKRTRKALAVRKTRTIIGATSGSSFYPPFSGLLTRRYAMALRTPEFLNASDRLP